MAKGSLNQRRHHVVKPVGKQPTTAVPRHTETPGHSPIPPPHRVIGLNAWLASIRVPDDTADGTHKQSATYSYNAHGTKKGGRSCSGWPEAKGKGYTERGPVNLGK